MEKGKPSTKSIVIPSIILITALFILMWILLKPVFTLEKTPAPETFFNEDVRPLLKKTADRNKGAKEDFIARIRRIFDKYEAGIKPFAEDMCSYGTRFAILMRMPGDFLSDEEKVEKYVQGKLEKHIFSEDELKHDLEKAFVTLQKDLAANRNRLLSNVRAAVDNSDVPLPQIPDIKGYEEKVRQQIKEISAEQGKRTVLSGILALAVGESSALLAEQIVVRLLTTYGTTAATSAAASVGTTTTAATTGGTAGTLGGPVGTAIGIAAGVIISIPIDMLLNAHFQNELENKMSTYMAELEEGMLHGNSGKKGLIPLVDKFTRSLNKAQRQAMKKAIVRR